MLNVKSVLMIFKLMLLFVFMDKERKEYFDKITRGARHTELIRWVCWGFFRKRKWKHMNKKLELGMRFSLAMHQTKNEL